MTNASWVSVAVLPFPSYQTQTLRYTFTSQDPSMRNLLTTQNQNCYRELIMKEAYTRLNWKTKYGKDYPTSFNSRRSRSMGLSNPTTVTTKPTTKITLPPVVRSQGKRAEAPARVERSLSEAPLMRPVSPQTKETLYQGFSKEGQGRCLYLKRRIQKGPEEKYDYPILSSWEYGWKLADYEHNYRSPAHGRSGVVRSTFYARNGIFNIPSATDRVG